MTRATRSVFYIEIFHDRRRISLVIMEYNILEFGGAELVRYRRKKKGERRRRRTRSKKRAGRAWRVNRGYLRRHEFKKVGSVKYEGSIQLKINLPDDPSNPRNTRRGQHGARFPVVHLRVRARFCRMARAWWSINGRLHKSPARWFTTNNSRDTRVRACVTQYSAALFSRGRIGVLSKSIDHLSRI